MSLLDNKQTYKPFSYPWAYEAYELQNKMHWGPHEIVLDDDKRDWDKRLSSSEKNFLQQIFRFFTQGDICVANGYIDKFMPQFKHPEIRMMMSSFANMEAVHIDAYSQLLDTVGMGDSEYQAFLEYEEMANKAEYVDSFEVGHGYGVTYRMSEDLDSKAIFTPSEGSLRDLAKAIAVYSAFTEGLQLFSSFAMLLNFTRFGKMKGMGQIVTWSVRDESLHVESMIKLFRTFIGENLHIWTDEFKGELYEICRQMVDLEDKFVDLAFELGGVQGLAKEDVKQFVRYIADRRLLQLGLKPNYGVKDNPLPWYDEMLNSTEHANFFENTVTEYSKGTLKGSWDDNVWAKESNDSSIDSAAI